MERPSYKCIKHYPGGPCSGYVLKPQGSHWNNMWYWYMNNWFNPEEFPEYWRKVEEIQPEYKFHADTKSVTRLRDNAYFSIGQRITTPVSNNICFIYDIGVKGGRVICNNTHSFLLNKSGLDWLDVADPCEYSKKDMIEFAKYHSNNVKFDGEPHLEYWMNHVKK